MLRRTDAGDFPLTREYFFLLSLFYLRAAIRPRPRARSALTAGICMYMFVTPAPGPPNLKQNTYNMQTSGADVRAHNPRESAARHHKTQSQYQSMALCPINTNKRDSSN